MNAKELAQKLNGRIYGDEMTDAEEANAKKAGLAVVFGASDDLCEFRGAINDEIGCYEGKDIQVTKEGPIAEHEDCECEFCGYKNAIKDAKTITAIWDKGGYSWQYETAIPHATFEIIESDPSHKYCRGIVFSIKDL